MTTQDGSHYPVCRACGKIRPFEGRVRFDARPCPFCGGEIEWKFIPNPHTHTPPEGLERIKRYVDKCDHIGYSHTEIRRVVCDSRTITICVRCGREVTS